VPRIRKQEEPKSRLKKILLGLGIGCGSVLVLLLIGALVIYHQVTARPPAIAGVRVQPSGAGAAAPPAQPGTAGATGNEAAPQPPPVDTQIQEIKRAVETRQAVPVSFRAGESQLNQYIAQKIDARSPVQNVQVTLRSGDLVATGSAVWNGRPYYWAAVGTPQVVGGRLGFRLNSGYVGRVPMPSSALARFQAEIDRAMADGGLVGKDVQVTGASIANGELTMSGQTVPH